jgi:hypothetical protein
MFLASPEELRRTHGENATDAASILRSVRPAIFTVFAVMVVVAVVIGILASGTSGSFPGWAVTVIVLDVVGACVVMTVVIMHKAKRAASLRSGPTK